MCACVYFVIILSKRYRKILSVEIFVYICIDKKFLVLNIHDTSLLYIGLNNFFKPSGFFKFRKVFIKCSRI
jgi:hypothetical protein